MSQVTFNLSKDQPTFSLAKDSAIAKDMYLGLSWTCSADVDLSAALVSESGQIVDSISFRNKKRWLFNDSMYHFGDDMTGSDNKTDTDNEQIRIKLDKVPANVKYIYSVATVYSGRIEGAKMSLRESSKGPATLSGQLGGGSKGLILARLARDGDSWKVERIAATCNGSTISSSDVVNKIRAHVSGETLPESSSANATSSATTTRTAPAPVSKPWYKRLLGL